MIKVTIYNEFYHEQSEDKVKSIYPEGIHTAIANFLKCDDISVKTVTLYDQNLEVIPNCGITEELLRDTDVLIWWGHMRHGEVPDEIAQMVQKHVHCGMGMIFLHSAHHSKPFKLLMGTTCNLKWRDDEKERLWVVNPAHPIMQGIGEYFDIPKEEMYGERFEIPNPDDILMIGTYSSHEVFRSACTWQRLNGKIFYLQPGHESNPIYHMPEIQTIIKNAIRWAAPVYRAEKMVCPQVNKIDF